MSDAFRILVVCTGNICRSPAAEYLLRSGLTGHDVEIASAGTRAMAGRGIAAPMLELLAERGVDGSHHVARQLSRSALERSDLVLTATRAHRSAVATLYPAGVKRTHTLAEFGMLVAAEAPASGGLGSSLRALTSRARRPIAHPSTGGDIVDPYGRTTEVYRSALRQIDEAIQPLLQWSTTIRPI